VAQAITTEFENVPAPALAALAQHRPVAPGCGCGGHLRRTAPREKAHFARCGVPVCALRA